jgi:hypothetical protein
MTLSGDGEFCIKKSGLVADVCFCAPVSSEVNAVIEDFKDSATLLRVNSKSKLPISPGVNRCEFTVTWTSPANN